MLNDAHVLRLASMSCDVSALHLQPCDERSRPQTTRALPPHLCPAGGGHGLCPECCRELLKGCLTAEAGTAVPVQTQPLSFFSPSPSWRRRRFQGFGLVIPNVR